MCPQTHVCVRKCIALRNVFVPLGEFTTSLFHTIDKDLQCLVRGVENKFQLNPIGPGAHGVSNDKFIITAQTE